MCARDMCVQYVYKLYIKAYSAGLCTYVSFFRVVYHYLTIKMNVVTDVEIVDYFCFGDAFIPRAK